LYYLGGAVFMFELSDEEFQYIAKIIYNYAKINLTEKKRSLVISRLSKRIRMLGMKSFAQYIEYLKTSGNDSDEFQKMVDALSTNYSLFFREPYHFDFLQEQVFPGRTGGPLNIWSAAASTGQEIYTILITLMEYQRRTGEHFSYNLYASDINSEVLRTASRGIYPRKDTGKIPQFLLERYFLSGKGEQQEMVKVKKELVKKVRFFRLNLSDKEYSLPQMDVIFLRNVIIYFDKDTKVELIDRLCDYLKPGGYLFLGHSESLSGISDRFYVRGKTVYQRKS
jgi:chemotaxis protein methyltransferase CheR